MRKHRKGPSRNPYTNASHLSVIIFQTPFTFLTKSEILTKERRKYERYRDWHRRDRRRFDLIMDHARTTARSAKRKDMSEGVDWLA